MAFNAVGPNYFKKSYFSMFYLNTIKPWNVTVTYTILCIGT